MAQLEFPSPTARRDRWVCAVIVALAAILVYTRARHGGFVWDDMTALVENAAYRTGDGWKQLVFKPFLDAGNYFRPFVLTMFVVQVRGFDANPHDMHMVNIGLHTANAVLVTLLVATALERLRTPRNAYRLGCLSLGLVYALHPVLVEPVAWISGQFDLWVTFFCLLALWVDATLPSKPLRVCLVGLLFFLAMLCKEAAVIFPSVLVVAHWVQQEGTDVVSAGWMERIRRIWRQQGTQYIVLVAAGCGYLLLRYISFGYLLLPTTSQANAPGAPWAMPFYLYAKYFQLIFWPFVGLGPLHEGVFAGATAITTSELVVTIAGVLLSALAVVLATRGQVMGYAMLLLGIALLPVLQLAGTTTGSSIWQQRFLTLPMGAVLSVTGADLWEWARHALSRRPLLMLAGCCGLAFWLLAATANVWVTVPLWNDNISLWRWVLVSSPHSDYARTNLLSMYIQKGMLDVAIPLANMIESDVSATPLALLNAASAYLSGGDVDRGVRLIDRANEKIERGDTGSLYLLIMLRGEVFTAKGQHTEAVDAFRDALQVMPLDTLAQTKLSMSLVAAGQIEAAVEAAARAEELCIPSERAAWRKRFHDALEVARVATPKLHD